jgi:hypothetical protein
MNVILTQIGQAPAPQSNIDKFRQAIFNGFSGVFTRVEMDSVDNGAIGQPDLIANVDVTSSMPSDIDIKFRVTLIDPDNNAIMGNYSGESSGPVSTGGEVTTYVVGSLLTLDILLPVFLDQLHDKMLTHIETCFSQALDKAMTKIRNNRQPLMAAIKKSRDAQAELASNSGPKGGALSSDQISDIVKATVQGLKAGDASKAAPPSSEQVSDVDSPSFHARTNLRNFALIIGVEHYPGDIPSSEFSDRDAKTAFRYMRALGIPADHIKRLSDETATRSRIEGALHWLSRNVRPGATVWVYFSGHGSPGPHGTAYLVPSDGDPNDLQDTGFPLSTFYKTLNGLPAKRVIVALDSCFSGTGSRSVIGKGIRPLVVKIRSTAFPSSGKVISFAAAQSDQEAGVIEKQGHGMFTYYFLKGLNGKADDHGRVTVAQLYQYLKDKVSEKADLDNRSQVPQLEPVPLEKVASIRLR